MHKHSKHHKHMDGTSEEMHEMSKHKHFIGEHKVSHHKAAKGHSHLAAGMPKMPKHHSGK